MPYLPNLASAKEEVYAKSVEALARELERCRILCIPYLVTHLGSHLGAGLEMGRERIVSALDDGFFPIRRRRDPAPGERLRHKEQHG